jgi:hypothetical protein
LSLTRDAQSIRQWQIPLLHLPHEAKSGLPRGCCVTRLATEFSINPGLARSTASQRRSVTAANLLSSSLLTPALSPSPSYPPYSVCIPLQLSLLCCHRPAAASSSAKRTPRPKRQDRRFPFSQSLHTPRGVTFRPHPFSTFCPSACAIPPLSVSPVVSTRYCSLPSFSC